MLTEISQKSKDRRHLWIQLATFATNSDKICKMTNRGLFPEEIQEHFWDHLLVVALLQPRHMSFEQSGKLVRILIGLLFRGKRTRRVKRIRGTTSNNVVDVIAWDHWPANKVCNVRSIVSSTAIRYC